MERTFWKTLRIPAASLGKRGVEGAASHEPKPLGYVDYAMENYELGGMEG